MNSNDERGTPGLGDAATPAVSVIIGVPGFAQPTLAIPGVKEIVEQAAQAGAETIAVRTRRNAEGIGIAAELLSPGDSRPLDLVDPPKGRLTPHLWQSGIQLAQGRLIVLTLAGLRPAEGWLQAHIDANADAQWAGVGGPIEADPKSSLVDKAIAVSRYSAFLLPFEAQPVDDIAADNASYTREAIDECEDLIQDGFWEPPVHQRMKSKGRRLLLSPAPVMRHAASTGYFAFISQRIRHGFRFGRDRRAHVGTAWILKYLALSPALPFVLTLRVASRWRARGRSAAGLLPLLPILFTFNKAWVLGEIAGTIAPGGRATPSLKESRS